jgi:uncharacterized membrane protein YagU involved in acid resistance
MDRTTALVLSFVFFLVFGLIAYFGACVTAWSSFIFGLFVSFLLLNIFYPVTQVTDDDPDASLYVYVAFILIAVALLAIYITHSTLSDRRV